MQYIAQTKLKDFRKKNEPTVCPLLNHKASDWVVDHCHTGGTIRGIVSSEGNVMLGRIENAYKRLSKKPKQNTLPYVLRKMANYLEKPSSEYLHPVGYRQLYKRFFNLNKSTQLDILMKLGINRKLIQSCNNSKDRTKIYKQYLRNENNTNEII